jgi:2-oxo-4-hydroxy-4-carboxy-5-ureidoimidazoline decarboxylase
MTDPCLNIAALNAMEPADFIDALGDIYEHARWVAAAAAALRPFAGGEELAAAMARIVREADPARQMALLRAHPELGARGRLAPESAIEQRERGIGELAEDQARRLEALNTAYRERFGYPFIIAVRGQRDVTAIMHACERRLAATAEQERRTALEEVEKIAGFRLARRLAATP